MMAPRTMNGIASQKMLVKMTIALLIFASKSVHRKG
jgi:hypothetical protein